MNWLESRLLQITTFVLTLTGVLYAIMHYLIQSKDPFSVVNHPWEPYMLTAHILTAPLLILIIGAILHSHILYKLQTRARIARQSGIVLIFLFLFMVSSGYLLQVITGEFRKSLVWIHLGTGLLWFIFYVAHLIASLKLRRIVGSAEPESPENNRVLYENHQPVTRNTATGQRNR
jgi:hypothetical protein